MLKALAKLAYDFSFGKNPDPSSFEGLLDGTFSNTKVDLLEKALAKSPLPSEIIAKQTSKSASFRIHVKPISDFATRTQQGPP